MNADRKRLIFAAALGAAAFALAWGWLHLQEERLLHQGEEIKILAAKRWLPAHTRLEAKDLAWLRLPRAYAPTGVISDPAEAIGRQTLVPFSAEEPIIFNKLALGDPSLSGAVPEGQRALSLPVDSVSGLSGLLQPGDRVDLLLVHGRGASARAGLLLQNKTVLAVGRRLRRDGEDGGASTVTLALTPEESVLVLAARGEGEIHLTLRAAGDTRPAGTAQSSFADALRRLERAPAKLPEQSAAAPSPEDYIPRKR
jgi:pilus assembly protein CpaB